MFVATGRATAQAQDNTDVVEAADAVNATTPAPDGTPASRARGETLPPPEILGDADILPLAGDDLQKAKLNIKDAIQQVKAPAFLEGVKLPADFDPTADPDDAADGKTPEDAARIAAKDRDPPAAALKAYIRGRAAYLQNARWEAARQLEQAHRLDPKSPEILRLLGTVYFDMGNHVRGAQRLQDAVKLDPSDSSSLFLLGRFAFQKGRWDEALVTLAHSAHAGGEGVDPVERLLRVYYMGQSLMRLGYDAAAIEMLARYFELPVPSVRATMLHRELAFLNRQRDRVYMQIGDALMRLGRVSEAIKRYSIAAPSVMTDAHDLIGRRVYALLVMKQQIVAERTLVESLRRGERSSKVLELVPYVANHTDDRQRFVELLESVYEQNERPAAMAMAIAEMLDDDAAQQFLIDHLANRPGDLLSYNDLLQRLAEKNMGRLVGTVVQLIQLRPDSAEDYTEGLGELRLRVDDVIGHIDRLPDKQKDTAAAWYLRGFALRATPRVAEAINAFNKAMAIDPDFLAAQLAAVGTHVRLRQFDEALQLLDTIEKDKQDQPELRFARARVFTGLGRHDDAIRIVNKLLADQPRSVDYRIFKSQLEIARQDLAAAERTLLSILDFDPVSESAYTALFDLYENNPRTDSTQWLRLLKRARDEVPASRIARLKMAEWYDANRQYDRAEALLKELIDENRSDYEALVKLINVYKRANRWEAAETLLLELIDENPDDPTPLELFAEIAQRQGQLEQFFARMEQHLKRKDATFDILERLAQLYSRWDKHVHAVDTMNRAVDGFPDDAKTMRADVMRVRRTVMLYLRGEQPDRAITQIDLAIDENPNEAADLYYLKALVFHDKEAPEEAEKALLAALESDKNHAAANNDLGYLWADEGRNLEQALQMTTLAVAAEQENPAYLDSLGWVYYKLGRFDDAVRRLDEARTKPRGDDPVILDHLGDALWRAGRKEDAITRWEQAMKRARDGASPDNAKLRDALEGKINAARAAGEPTVAPLGENQKPPDAAN